jgi:GT2 family glycosyltransferase
VVVIVSYECRELIRRCLRSIERQRADLRLDVVVIDNDSSDGTVDAVRTEFPWVSVVPARANLGFSRANNLALRHEAGHRPILLLNPDTELPEGALRACLHQLERMPEVGVLGPRLVRADGTLDHACKRGFPTPGAAITYFLGLERVFPGRRRLAAYTAGHVADDETAYVDAVNGAFMLIRAETYADVGQLDERFWMYGEDLDWCMRAHQAGWRVLYWPEVSVLHHKAASSSTLRSWHVNRAFHDAMRLFYDKHYAAQHTAAFNVAVRGAIQAKLLASASRTALRRRTSSRARPERHPSPIATHNVT